MKEDEEVVYRQWAHAPYNPVKHGLVENAEDYRWCSMAWFSRNSEAGFQRTVLSFKYDRIKIEDDF